MLSARAMADSALLSVKQAGDLIGISRQAVGDACARGRLAYQWIGRDRFVKRADAEKYKRTREARLREMLSR